MHAAYHATPQHDPKNASPRHIRRAIKRRVQQRVEFEHAKAEHAARHEHSAAPRSSFQHHWIATGVAVHTRHGPRLAILGEAPPRAPLAAGTVHIRVYAALAKPTKKQAASAAWIVTAHTVQPDGSEAPRLRACGKVPTVAALGSHAPPQAANKATEQAGHQAGTAAALAYASQLVARGKGPAAITFASEIARRNLEQAGDPVVGHDRPSEASSSGGSNKRQRKRAPGGQKRARPLTEEEKQRIRAARPQNTIMNVENKQRLSALRRRFPGKITLRAPEGATPVTLHAQAQAAARLEDILAHVTITETGRTTSRAVSLWDESRTWDPGD